MDMFGKDNMFYDPEKEEKNKKRDGALSSFLSKKFGGDLKLSPKDMSGGASQISDSTEEVASARRQELEMEAAREPTGFQKFAAGFSGRNVNDLYAGQRNAQAQLDQMDKKKRLDREESDYNEERDPKSQQSIMAQALMGKLMPGKKFDGMSYAQLKPGISSAERMYGIDQNNETKRDLAEIRKIQAEEIAKQKQEKEAYKKTAKGKLENMGIGEKVRFDSVKMGMESLNDMEDAYLDGDNTFSVVGDNNFTEARGRYEEALGRMQSGGVIGKEEVEKFKAMAPTWEDSPEMQKKKLQKLRSLMASRLNTLGFTPEELGLRGLSKEEKAPEQFNQMFQYGNKLPEI